MAKEKKYTAQQKHIRTHYVRLPIDLRPEILERLKSVCRKNGTTPTTEIKKFIDAYCAEHAEADQSTSQENR